MSSQLHILALHTIAASISQDLSAISGVLRSNPQASHIETVAQAVIQVCDRFNNEFAAKLDELSSELSSFGASTVADVRNSEDSSGVSPYSANREEPINAKPEQVLGNSVMSSYYDGEKLQQGSASTSAVPLDAPPAVPQPETSGGTTDAAISQPSGVKTPPAPTIEDTTQSAVPGADEAPDQEEEAPASEGEDPSAQPTQEPSVPGDDAAATQAGADAKSATARRSATRTATS